MNIKTILDEIGTESSTNNKMNILGKYKDNEILKRVLYLANSGRIKFYIKQIPEYTTDVPHLTLVEAFVMLEDLSSRKYTGQAATNHLQKLLSGLSIDDAYVVERIIAKDLKIGIGGNINKVIPNLIEETPYMGCKPYDVDKVKALFKGGKKCYGQVKMDGCYNNGIVRSSDVENESRQGEKVILDSALFVGELSKLNDCVLNGELTLIGESDRAKANGIVGSMVDIAEKINNRTTEETAKKIRIFEEENGCTYDEMKNRVVYTVWDMLTPEEYYDKKSSRPYHERLNKVVTELDRYDFTRLKVVEGRILNSFEEALEFFQECLNRGLEGCIIKSIDGEWKDTKPSYQIKMKLEMNVDLLIIGFNYGKKGTKNEFVISSLICQSSDGLLTAEPGGMDEKTMKYVTDNMDILLHTIVDTKSCGITHSKGKHSLLHPRVGSNKFRTDKRVADSYEEILAIENMCKGLTK
jgi:hypothetical protein